MSDTVRNSTVYGKKFWKFVLVTGVLGIGLLAVVYRLFTIQVLNGSKYRDMARRQHESKVNISAERGNIYDRNGNLLASNFRSVSVAADPNMLGNKKALCRQLSLITGYSESAFLKKINNAKGSFVWLARGLNPGKLENISELDDQGVILIKEPKRIYHYNKTGAQILGITDIDGNGLTGIEKRWDSVLKGRSGYMVMNRDALGRLRPAADLPVFPAVDGNSVKLTIDIELQEIVEHELKKGVLSSGALSGTVIALEPNTGEIMAVASFPTFNPHRRDSINPASTKIKAVTDVYEPGSTFKLVTAAAALEENYISEDDTVFAHNGYFRGRGFAIRDVHGYGRITFREALENSSNIVFGKIAAGLDDNVLYSYQRNFGFGLKSDVDLIGEVSGLLKKPNKYTGASKYFMGFGYEMNCTPLQLVNAYSAVANGGELMRPHVVKQIINSENEILFDYKPQRIRRVISETTSDRLTGLLVNVVENGTGKAVKMEGIKIAGKTGTSQQLVEGRYSKSKYYASFAGWFPAEEPGVAMLVVVDSPSGGSYYGGSIAAPVFRDIAARWIAKTPKFATEPEVKELTYVDSVRVPEIIGLEIEEAHFLAESYGFDFRSNFDEGVVTVQSPVPGTYTRKGITVSADSILNESSGIPELKGLSLRSALVILSKKKIDAEIIGSGKVDRVVWPGKKEKGRCKLYCSPG